MCLRASPTWLLPCVLLGARVASAMDLAPPPLKDDWLGPDKALHFSLSAGLAGAGYAGGALLCPESPQARWLAGTGLALGAGVGKELYDLGRGSHFSWRDVAWDVAGTATGLALSWLIEQLLPAGARPTSTRPAPLRPALAPSGQGRWALSASPWNVNMAQAEAVAQGR